MFYRHRLPIRLRVECQLGFKQAKYLMKIALVSSFEKTRERKGGYWEEHGYEWYAGI
jgi:DMSO/TMAO reductase YedYZ molybdopterin-dependent catalytic subunit